METKELVERLLVCSETIKAAIATINKLVEENETQARIIQNLGDLMENEQL
jgi:hypothetical protein